MIICLGIVLGNSDADGVEKEQDVCGQGFL